MENIDKDIIDPIDLALLRKGSGGNEAISIGENGKLLSNGDKDRDKVKYRLILRSPTRNGGAQSSRAKSLMECKGLTGCEFAQCAEKAFGKLPKNLQNLCRT